MGLYDPDSLIQVKILSTVNGERFTKEWLYAKLNEAYTKRASLLATDTNAYRLCFGENDSLPGLVCDVYDKVVVVKLYAAIWLPHLALVVEALTQLIACTSIVLRLSRLVAKHNHNEDLQEGTIIHGQLDQENVAFIEHGVLFKANVLKGHKTGFFLDHRPNRLKVQQMSMGKRVLDVFSYAGGFSVHALVGGAAEVTSLDISEQALSLAHANGAINKASGVHKSLCGDAFKLLRSLVKKKITFDIVIIDPPAFAKAEKEIEFALSKYQALALLGAQLTSRGGTLILASCSSRVKEDDLFPAFQRGIKDAKSHLTLKETGSPDVDHPVGFLEGGYLKCGYYK